jgi:outer membrane protein W
LEKALVEELINFDLKGKTIAQFCCNNERELLSLYKMGAVYGVGFDIAENQISFANMTAKKLQMKVKSKLVCKLPRHFKCSNQPMVASVYAAKAVDNELHGMLG